MSSYGWVIDQDTHPLPGAPAGTNGNAIGLTGPSNISDNLKTRLTAGEGVEFRLRDADGYVDYLGRIVFAPIPGGNDDFGPLDDFGSNAGDTEIQYLINARWVTL